MRITVRDVPEDIVSMLDTIVSKEGYSSRNALIISILTEYVTMGDSRFVALLPPIVKALCETELSNLTADAEKTVETISLAVKKLLAVIDRINRYFAPEYLDNLLDGKAETL